MTRILRAIGEDRPFTDAELTTFREHGEMRAGQGISIEDTLVDWRLVVRTALETLADIGRDNGVTDRNLLDLTHDILALTDIAPLGAGEGAETLLETVRHYLSLGMRADLAAERLFVHHNTVRYRLRRYEELTGTILRDPDRALEAWWALQRHRLTGSPE